MDLRNETEALLEMLATFLPGALQELKRREEAENEQASME